ncbi:ROK family transcriptional regulator [Microbacterium sp. X-17]|uniref:ROK family transcriptional regulator n=1 Tax=Microbacterium sp. X-17 TaxID=3144404 RepID=UPI0031F58708
MIETVGVRRQNLSRILRRVHLQGPQSRAALTEATGLNRSTIADLVAELVAQGLVEERAPDPSRRVGRPSPVVSVDPRIAAIAVNPEVDAVELAAVRLDQSIVARARIEVAHLVTPEETARLTAERIAQWRRGTLRGDRLVAVGVAVPGLVRATDGLVRRAPHLEWTDAPLRELVEDATGLPVTVGNDATLGALAEHLYGAARGVDDVIYLNGGASGIGGGLIVQGRAVHGAAGYAGEFGQSRPGIGTDADRRVPGGVLEDEVSRARLLQALGRASADDTTLWELVSTASDPAVDIELGRQRRILATALANAVDVLNPSAIVLGGFLTIVAGDLGELVAEVRAQTMPASAEHLEIRSAELRADRLLIGAAESAFAPLLASPLG